MITLILHTPESPISHVLYPDMWKNQCLEGIRKAIELPLPATR